MDRLGYVEKLGHSRPIASLYKLDLSVTQLYEPHSRKYKVNGTAAVV